VIDQNFSQDSEKHGFFKKSPTDWVFWFYWVFWISYLNEQLQSLLADLAH